jgi:hypothetical protein
LQKSADDQIDADVARIADAARQLLRQKVAADDILRMLHPRPHPHARLRAGPTDASWRQITTPLLGLSHLTWSQAPDALDRRLREKRPELSPDVWLIRVAETPVFPEWWLVDACYCKELVVEYDLIYAAARESSDAFGDVFGPFDWSGPKVVEFLNKSSGNLATHHSDYLRIFCALTASEESRFPLVDSDDLIHDRAKALPVDLQDREALREKLQQCAPPELLGIWPNGSLRYRANILYDNILACCEFELRHQGFVEMVEDKIVYQVEPQRVTQS